MSGDFVEDILKTLLRTERKTEAQKCAEYIFNFETLGIVAASGRNKADAPSRLFAAPPGTNHVFGKGPCRDRMSSSCFDSTSPFAFDFVATGACTTTSTILNLLPSNPYFFWTRSSPANSTPSNPSRLAPTFSKPRFPFPFNKRFPRLRLRHTQPLIRTLLAAHPLCMTSTS